jgi:hypothetical protein
VASNGELPYRREGWNRHTPEVGDPRSCLTSHLSHEISDVDRKGCARPLGFL